MNTTNKSVLLKADSLLLNHLINRLPLTLEELERISDEMNWILDTYQQAIGFIEKSEIQKFVKDHKAFTTIHDGQTIILYDGQLPYSDKLQCICHEMGHIILRHTTEHGIIGLCTEPMRMAKQEQEADAFAAEMMAPACVMRDRGISSIEELIETGFISGEQAVNHYENIVRGIDTDEEQQLCDLMRSDFNPKPQKQQRKLGMRFRTTIVTLVIIVIMSAIGAFFISRIGKVVDVVDSEQSDNSLFDVSTSLNTEMVSGNNDSSIEASSIPRIDEYTVYITANGKKYHVLGCYYIEGKHNLIELSVEDAEKAGYEPCKYCC